MVWLALLLLWVGNAQPLSKPYIVLQEGAEKCFTETVPSGLAIKATYTHIDNPGIACSIIFKNPKGRMVYSHAVGTKDSKGHVSYTATEEGTHSVCINCPSSQWFTSANLKWFVTVEVADDYIGRFNDVVKKEDISGLQQEVRIVLSKLDTVAAENEYEKKQEEYFRNSSESVNTAIVTMAGFNIFVVVLVSVFSLWSLRSYFRVQKLI
eukprot:Trichotokara_eunicae@DN5790_c0_g1_i2.p1